MDEERAVGIAELSTRSSWRRALLPALALGLWVGLGCGEEGSREKAASTSSPGPIAWVSDRDTAALTPDVARTIPPGTDAIPGALGPDDPRLTKGSSYDLYTGHGQAGDLLKIRMQSAAFASQIALFEGSDEKAQLLDVAMADSAGAALELGFELLHDGSYLVLATSAHAGETGSYSIEADTEPVQDFPTRGPAAQTYALVVSIADYPRHEIDLDGPHRDAELFIQLLVDRFGVAPANIVHLRDERATRRRITAAWLDHLGQAGEDGAALFYYSGHGIQIPQTAETSRANRESDGQDEALLLANGSVLIDDELGSLADGLRAGSTTLVLDCCYSGAASRARAGQPKRARLDRLDFPVEIPRTLLGLGGSGKTGSAAPRPHRLLAAAGEDEVAWVIQPTPALGIAETRSLFTYYLVRALASAPPEGTLAELGEVVRVQTRKAARETLGQNQTPTFSGVDPFEPVRVLAARR
jgi:hypothetical protein